jgi:hypothetical protein
MKVNSSKVVAKLNADTVDGKHAEDFYAAGSKVADSSHADQADSAANAQNASDSELLDGRDSSEFASYKRTVVVSPVGSATQNGSALLAALNGITDASATNPYLLYIEAGTYDLDIGWLQMTPYVHIEGAGEDNTIITSAVGRCAGTVHGANNAELRLLTVRNTSTNTAKNDCGVGISNNSASPRLTQVTVESTGGGDNYAVDIVSSSNPTMTNVTATASGGSMNIGMYNDLSSPTIRNSRISGTNDSLWQTGGTIKVAVTQLVGGVSRMGGTLQCFNNYNENMQPVTCP